MRYLLTLVALLAFNTLARAEPLPSWTDGPTKTAITAFVDDVTTASSPSFVPPAERIAVFDNDGTLWVEQPMLELLDYLRADGFKTFIVSGGGIEFMRAWTERVYGIPPEQVIGSQIAMQYEVQDGTPVLIRQPEVAFIDDETGKPVGIQRHIGRRPILAFGNSDGDYQMLEWTTAGAGKRLGLILHHDDVGREYAYDRESHVGRLSKGLADAGSKGWVLVSMKRDWSRIFPATPAGSPGTEAQHQHN